MAFSFYYYPLSFVIGMLMLIANGYFPTQHCCVNAGRHRSNETDMLSLLAIKSGITRDPMDSLSSWNTCLHFCEWKGVICSKRHQRVIILDLRSQSLTGYISPAIGNLSFLRVIDFGNNSFQGEIPPELRYLYRLEGIFLNRNELRGMNFHNLSSWSNLGFLHLASNNFIGQVPFEIGSLSRLIRLEIYDNNFSGPIPSSFGNLTSLQALYASKNMLTGPVPREIGRLTRLKNCSLELNNLSGIVPSTIYNLSQLIALSLGGNFLRGVLPCDMFSSLPKLKILLLWGNNFSGVIPVSISNASNLEMVELQHNKLFGIIPVTIKNPNLRILKLGNNSLESRNTDDLNFITSLTNCSHLRCLQVSLNNLGGALPASIGKLSTKLEILSAGGNQFSGNIPESICNLTNLNVLELSYNQLTGGIPLAIGSLEKLRLLYLSINKLSGKIPSSIGNLISLIEFKVVGNSIEGNIPASLGNCRNLILLRLDDNALNGTIPRELMELASLAKSLNLSQNHLIGPLPPEVGTLTNLIALDVSENQLSGDIPVTLGKCLSLRLLNLDGNSFHGTIPSTLKALRGLEEFNLSNNNLSGALPKDLGNLPFLQKLDLSYNNFEGEVPTMGVFNNTSQILLFGNQGLCGGILDLHLPTCIHHEKEKTTLSFALKLVIILICGFLGVSLVIVFLWALTRKKERKQPSTKFVFHEKLRNVSYQDLFKATNGFSQDNIVGKGGFGSVYKGTFEQDQTIVAIKVLDLQNRGASTSFIRECEALRNTRHKNLVKVVTVCSSIDHQGHDFKAIIYQFMPNGNLEKWLYPDPTSDIEIRGCFLSLFQRLSIAIDVASALDYLHNECEMPIIHCDLKPSNILLDDQMIAHVGDFGLAKIVLPTDAPNEISSSTCVKGTIGYAAPEYGMGSEATIQGDIYSFGILLLEIFTGKKPIDDMFKDGLDLHRLAKITLSKGVMKIIDHNLLLKEEEGPSIVTKKTLFPIQECLSSVIKIGVGCSEESPRDRMSIHDALKELHSVQKLVSDRNNLRQVVFQV